MIDLTAPIETYGVTQDITHMDLYYRGTVAPASSLITECVLIDLTAGAAEVKLEGLPELNLVQPGGSVILKTSWERYRGTPEYDRSPSVDRKLIEELIGGGVVLILIDSPGVYGGKKGAEHSAMDKYLVNNGAFAVENLVNVVKLSKREFRLYCFPITMTSQNSAPCRVVADHPSPPSERI